MPDLGWSNYIAGVERQEYLESLTVVHTLDEHGNPRFFVEDFEGDWVGEAFDTYELAQEKIKELRGA
jgi:hypothetical protein